MRRLRTKILRRGGVALLLSLTALAGSAKSSPGQTPTDKAPSQNSTGATVRIDAKPTNLAPDIVPESLWDGRLKMPFHSLDDPKMVKAAEADFVDDDEYVLALTVNGESRAYPTRYIWWHHIVNDTIGGTLSGADTQTATGSAGTGSTSTNSHAKSETESEGARGVPIAVTYCSVCNTGVCYDPTIDSSTVKLDFYGLYNGTVALCERETESVMLQASGRFISGSLRDKSLKTIPILDTTWGEWKSLHPDTLVMSPDTIYKRAYPPKGRREPRGYDRFPMPVFAPTVTHGDSRLPNFQKVLGVTVRQENRKPDTLYRAYPISALQKAGIVNDKIGSAPVAIFFKPKSLTAVALSRQLDGKTLTFEMRKQSDGADAIFDRGTGTRWNIEGRGVEGPLANKSLTRLENHLSQWYGWVAYFPTTSVYGSREKPQIGKPFVSDSDSKTVPKVDAKPVEKDPLSDPDEHKNP